MTEGIDDEYTTDEVLTEADTLYLNAEMLRSVAWKADKVASVAGTDAADPVYQAATRINDVITTGGLEALRGHREDVRTILSAMTEEHKVYTLPSPFMSFSQVNLYKTCGERYRRKYVEREQTVQSSNLAHGKLVHSVLEQLNAYKMVNKITPPQSMADDLVSTLSQANLADIEQWDPKVPDKVVFSETAHDLVRVYVKERLPSVRPRALELNFIQYINGTVPFQGYIDLVDMGEMKDEEFMETTTHAAPEISVSDIVVDFKVTGKNYSPSRVNNSLQLSIYAGATGAARVQFDLLVQSKRGAKYEAHQGMRTLREVEHAGDVVEDVAKAISAGIFPKADPESWVCDPKWCSHYNDCRARKRGATVLVTEGISS